MYSAKFSSMKSDIFLNMQSLIITLGLLLSIGDVVDGNFMLSSYEEDTAKSSSEEKASSRSSGEIVIE